MSSLMLLLIPGMLDWHMEAYSLLVWQDTWLSDALCCSVLSSARKVGQALCIVIV